MTKVQQGPEKSGNRRSSYWKLVSSGSRTVTAVLGIFIAPALNTLVAGPSINQDEILAARQILETVPRKR